MHPCFILFLRKFLSPKNLLIVVSVRNSDTEVSAQIWSEKQRCSGFGLKSHHRCAQSDRSLDSDLTSGEQ